MSKPEFTLPSQLVSPRDIRELLLELESLKSWQTQHDVAKEARTTYPISEPELSRDASGFVHSWTKSGLTIEAIMEHLSKSLHAAPILTVTLAAEASKDIQATIVKWCRINLSDTALVQFKTDPSLVGGMTMRIGSRLFDWSYRTKLIANKDRLRELVGNEHKQ